LTLRLISDSSSDAPEPEPGGREGLSPAAFEELFEHAGSMLAILDDDGRFVAVNPACRRILGHDPQELVGQSLLELIKPHSPSRALSGHPELSPGGQPEDDRAREFLARHGHADGSWRWLLWSGATHGGHWYGAARDVTDWIRLEDRAGRDPLTQLPNREVFTAQVTSALARHERSGRFIAVLFVDIDSLKRINDSIGHHAGDRLVAEVAERLRLAVRTGDIVARLGGDEFGILVESLGDELEAVTVAERAMSSFEQPVELDSGSIAISASIGVSTAHGAPTTAGTLIHEADIAMYQAKAAGRNRFAIFDAALRAQVEQRAALERDLRSALERDELALDYEPVVSLLDGEVLGFEAALHWVSPTRGVVPLAEFMPLAERNALIVPLGVWALRAAAEQVASWRIQGHDVFVGLRVTPGQLADDEFIKGIDEVLETIDLPPRALGIEVAEAAALLDPTRTIERLATLRERGVRVAFDDFGSGYSSLQHLIQLPVDEIKVDRSLVAGLSAEDPRASRAIVLAVVAAARELGTRVVAEGAENQRQLDELLAVGCELAQGPVFGAPCAGGEVSFVPRAQIAPGAVRALAHPARPARRRGGVFRR
jgi:diguanylate cyclase (GGDEF)-like protein/PAS domain S-box-containing protein